MENTAANKVVLSMSGGLDSTMLAVYWLARGNEVRAYAFDYGQKHDIELKKLKKNIKFLQEKNLPITLQVINLRDCFADSASSLHKGSGEDIPKGHYEDDNMKSTVVENRNIIFSSIIYGKALAWSKKTNEDVIISLGIHAGDHTIYPDTTPESREAAAHTFKISNWGSERVSYVAPFETLTKDQVLDMGVSSMAKMDFNIKEIWKVLKYTHSCYDPNEKGESCGVCGTCTERIEAFEKLGMIDPIKYAPCIMDDPSESIIFVE